ncbi:type II toxin-antitoxin system RelE/ParE family toxin [Methylobacterium radiotolerans]|uniref:type II toxin-antitoxin system RelE/ParE family toxin n=1 Tax=Methylobacterium radiotolerans TaxID=31998 RepID=UPI0015F686B2|nr:type II toxin-antitoxin system RelE/ParE family toxin [Methylobacterium radiotolerans]
MGNSARARFTPLARSDLEEIWRYSSGQWSADQADRYHLDIVNAATELANGAKSGRPVEVRAGYLKYRVGSHFIFYRRTDAGIEVIRILHQRMDTDSHI